MTLTTMIKDEAAARGHIVSIVMTSRHGRSWSSIAAEAGMGKARAQRLWWQYREHVLTRDRRTLDTPAYHYHHERFGSSHHNGNVGWFVTKPNSYPHQGLRSTR